MEGLLTNSFYQKPSDFFVSQPPYSWRKFAKQFRSLSYSANEFFRHWNKNDFLKNWKKLQALAPPDHFRSKGYSILFTLFEDLKLLSFRSVNFWFSFY